MFLFVIMPALATASFPDVFRSDPFVGAIDYVRSKGIVAGYPDGLYQPDMDINRAEFTKILIKTKYNEEQIAACNGGSFKDIDASAWFAPYVCKAKEAGVIGGYPDGTFGPENQINFVEAAKIIVKTLKADELAAKNYPAGVWYEPYVHVMADLGALPLEVTGAESYVSRGLMAELIYRLNENVTDKDSFSFEEFGDRGLIVAYYDILGWDAEKAFAMKADEGMTLDAFKRLYPRDAASYHILQFSRVAAHVYDFYVWTTFTPAERVPSGLYHVKMEVVGGKLKTHSADPADNLVKEEVKYDDSLSARLVWSGGEFKIFTVKNGTETLAFQSDASESIVKNLNFSQSGNYLTFEIIGWEYGGVYVYDVVNKKLGERSYDGIQLYGFADQEKYFYFCSESGMSSGMAFVLNMPGFVMRRDLQADSAVGTCDGFDPVKNVLTYSLLTETGGYEKHSYDLAKDLINNL